jgi:hypothetical protein
MSTSRSVGWGTVCTGVVSMVLLAVLLGGCPSGGASNSTSSTSSTLVAAAKVGKLPPCPTAQVVNAALGQHDTGPVVNPARGGTEICTYGILTKVTIAPMTLRTFQAEEANTAASGARVTNVPGVGDKAFLAGTAVLFALKGTTFVQVASLASRTQLMSLARSILSQ